MTSLYDAIGTLLHKSEAVAQSYTKVIVMIITDGEENASRHFNKATIRKKITELSKDPKWEFMFVGANQDAILNGAAMGFEDRNCLTYTADPQHTKATFKALSENCTRGRSNPSAKMMFTKLERQTTESS